MNKKIFLPVLLVLLAVVSGCVGQQTIAEVPNDGVTIIAFSADPAEAEENANGSS